MIPDHLSTTFAALADPTRRGILARLSSGAASVTELAHPFDMTMPAISKHLKVLERAGLIARSREAQWRPCKLQPAPLKEVADWLENYRRFWADSFDRLDDYLRAIKKLEAKAPASRTSGSKPKGPKLRDAARRQKRHSGRQQKEQRS
jgi:DNA-binding transcriptional ArsR family regulator